MKKLLLLMLSLTLAAGLCGCEKRLAPMQLRAAPVSEETRQVLELTDNELTLWEYRTDGGTYDITMNFWVCRDGSWEKAQFYPGAAASEGRFGVHVTSTKVEYITLAEDGTCRYGTDCPVDVTSQRNAWIDSGKAEAAEWDDGTVISTPYKRKVFLGGDVKILGTMTDLQFVVTLM